MRRFAKNGRSNGYYYIVVNFNYSWSLLPQVYKDEWMDTHALCISKHCEDYMI